MKRILLFLLFIVSISSIGFGQTAERDTFQFDSNSFQVDQIHQFEKRMFSFTSLNRKTHYFEAQIDSFANFIARNGNFDFIIEAHRGILGNDDINLAASKMQANIIYKSFLEAGFDPVRIHFEGYGELYPIYSREDYDFIKSMDKHVAIRNESKNTRQLLRISTIHTEPRYQKYIFDSLQNVAQIDSLLNGRTLTTTYLGSCDFGLETYCLTAQELTIETHFRYTNNPEIKTMRWIRLTDTSGNLICSYDFTKRSGFPNSLSEISLITEQRKIDIPSAFVLPKLVINSRETALDGIFFR